MSSGAVAQLVARGAQDVHITGKPSITFFNSRFKTHTNFSYFNQDQTIEGDIKPGGFSTVKFKRSADLLGYTYLVLKSLATNETVLMIDWRGIIDKVELIIGGRVIDTQHSEFSETLAIDLLSNSYAKSYAASLHAGTGTGSYFYPFRFFFCEEWNTCLPLSALQFHDVELRIHWSQDLTLPLLYKFEVNSQCILLDKEERDKVSLSEHNMLIFQVQRQAPSRELNQELIFNHPVKYIASSNVAGSNSLASMTTDITIKINGNEIDEKKASVPYYTAIPSYYHTQYSSGNATNMFIKSFGLDVSKYQPTGTLNFSRIDSCRIECTSPINRNIYAVNYNILKIRDGMGSVMYTD
jgi:hypothetical protein